MLPRLLTAGRRGLQSLIKRPVTSGLATTIDSGPAIRLDSQHVIFKNAKQQGDVTKLPLLWLRDHCHCQACFNKTTHQREVNISDTINAARVRNWASPDTKTIHVEWEDGHRSDFDSTFLTERASPATDAARKGLVQETYWGSDMSRDPPTVDYSSIRKGNTATLAIMLRTFGICFVRDTPATPEATKEVMNVIGPLRDTHFGGLHIVQSDLSSKDTAYTDAALDMHTDTTYFSEPVGLLALHLMRRDGTGGQSVLVDGFGVARQLQHQDPAAYQALRDVRLFYHASGNAGYNIQPSFGYPTLLHDADNGRLTQVRWNNADRAGFAAGCEDISRWYDAASKLDRLMQDPKNRFVVQLEPGNMCVVDNWRILHGREAFMGNRALCTAYVPRDDFIAFYKRTNMSEQRIAASTVTG